MGSALFGFHCKSILAGAALVVLATYPAVGQERVEEPPATRQLALELNTAEQIETACRLVFMTRNDLGADLEELSFETVLFDAEGSVERFTMFDFRDIPAGKTRVRQFDLPDIQCDAIGRVLINSAGSCAGEGIAPTDCTDRLEPTTRIKMELVG